MEIATRPTGMRGMALAGNPDLMQAHVVLGRIYLAEQQPKLAIAELRQVAGCRSRWQLSFPAIPRV